MWHAGLDLSERKVNAGVQGQPAGLLGGTLALLLGPSCSVLEPLGLIGFG